MQRIGKFVRRHKFLCILAGVVVLWAVYRFFLAPPILAQTHFSRAYYDRNGELMRLTLWAHD